MCAHNCTGLKDSSMCAQNWAGTLKDCYKKPYVCMHRAMCILDMTVPSYVWMDTSSIGWVDGYIEH